MRVFRDIELVEQLGSGIPRILRSYGRACFHFSENYTRMSFPKAEPESELGLIVGVNVSTNVGANKLMEIIGNNPGLNSKQLAAYFDVTENSINL